jgi:hypothetical protein
MMEDGPEKKDASENSDQQEIFSKAVRAGKRTYFFDVKSTRRNDYYLTITESKKRFQKDGRFFFEKHKIFLYKEDFDKFEEGLTDVIEFIKSAKPVMLNDATGMVEEEEERTVNYTNVDFEDLESVEAAEKQSKE